MKRKWLGMILLLTPFFLLAGLAVSAPYVWAPSCRQGSPTRDTWVIAVRVVNEHGEPYSGISVEVLQHGSHPPWPTWTTDNDGTALVRAGEGDAIYLVGCAGGGRVADGELTSCVFGLPKTP